MSSVIKGNSVWPLYQTKFWAKWGMGRGLIFYHFLLLKLLLKLLSQIHVSGSRESMSLAWIPLALQLSLLFSKRNAKVVAKRFPNCIFPQRKWQLPFFQHTCSFLLSYGLWVMTEIYLLTNANTQGHHRDAQFTCQSIWHLCQEKATAEESPVKNAFSHTWERLPRIVNQ